MIQATCRICQKTIRKNCSGMRGHLTSKHQINIEEKNSYNDVEEYQTSIPSENIKIDMDVIDPNDYYEDVEQPVEDENEISDMPQDIGFTVSENFLNCSLIFLSIFNHFYVS